MKRKVKEIPIEITSSVFFLIYKGFALFAHVVDVSIASWIHRDLMLWCSCDSTTTHTQFVANVSLFKDHSPSDLGEICDAIRWKIREMQLRSIPIWIIKYPGSKIPEKKLPARRVKCQTAKFMLRHGPKKGVTVLFLPLRKVQSNLFYYLLSFIAYPLPTTYNLFLYQCNVFRTQLNCAGKI